VTQRCFIEIQKLVHEKAVLKHGKVDKKKRAVTVVAALSFYGILKMN
jgi:hypothetical protein